MCVVHTGAPGEPGDLGWPWAPISCPLAGGRAVTRACPGLFRVPGWCPRAGAGALLPQGRLACGQHRGQLCPCAWRGPATWGSSCSHRWGTQACRRLLMGIHSHVHTSHYGNTHTLAYVSLWVPTLRSHYGDTHTSPYSQQTLPSLDTHRHTLPYGQQTPPALGSSSRFILGCPRGFRVPAGLRPPLVAMLACPRPPGPGISLDSSPPGLSCLFLLFESIF